MIVVTLQASKNYMFSVTFNTLFIINATAEDSGNYSCSASNTLGRVTQMCPINIEPDVVRQLPSLLTVYPYVFLLRSCIPNDFR